MKQNNKFLYGWNLWKNDGNGWTVIQSYMRPEFTKNDVMQGLNEHKTNDCKMRVTQIRVLNPNYKTA